jgi:hypothetical protein
MSQLNLTTFERSLGDSAPPDGLPPLLLALWHERKGGWDRAHRIAQDIDGPDAAWVHAYLHRREGDEANAGYWYRFAARPVGRGNLDEEWRAIVGALLSAVRPDRRP